MQTAQTQRPSKVWRGFADDTAAPPQLLYEEPDEAFSLNLGQTHNQQHILLYGESMTTKYAMSLSAAQPEGNLSFSASSFPSHMRITDKLGGHHMQTAPQAYDPGSKPS